MAKGNTDSRISSWESDVNYFLEKFENKYLNYYLETYQLLENVPDEEIDQWISILTFFYPNVIGEYFKIYFSNLKLDVKKFLIKMDKKDLVGV